MSVSQTSNPSIPWMRACAVGVIKTVHVKALPWEPCCQSGQSGTFLETISRQGIITRWFAWCSEYHSCPDTETPSCLPRGAECWGTRHSVTCMRHSPEMMPMAGHLRHHFYPCEDRGWAGLIAPETEKNIFLCVTEWRINMRIMLFSE